MTKVVTSGNAVLASFNAAGAFLSNDSNGPDTFVRFTNAGFSNGATGSSASNDGLATCNVPFNFPNVVFACVKNAGNALIVAVRDRFSAAVAPNTLSPDRIKLCNSEPLSPNAVNTVPVSRIIVCRFPLWAFSTPATSFNSVAVESIFPNASFKS